MLMNLYRESEDGPVVCIRRAEIRPPRACRRTVHNAPCLLLVRFYYQLPFLVLVFVLVLVLVLVHLLLRLLLHRSQRA